MVKECACSCKERPIGSKEWKGMTIFKIAELDVLRGIPGYTDIDSVVAKDKEDAVKRYYELHPNASDRLLIYPKGCATVYTKEH